MADFRVSKVIDWPIIQDLIPEGKEVEDLTVRELLDKLRRRQS